MSDFLLESTQHYETVELDFSVTDNVEIDVHDADGDRAVVDITHDEAIQVADAIYEGTGRKNPSNLVKASDLSVNDALIRVAELHGLRVRFRYAKTVTAPVETRTFVPKGLQVLADHTTFNGIDEDRGGFRSFRTDRIKGTVEVVA
jgi:predicted DNA-binding transcriptional regulator YafY